MRRRYLLTFFAAAGLAGGLFFGVSCCSARGPVVPYEAVIQPDAPAKFILFGDSRETLGIEFWRPRYDDERLLVIQALAAEDPAFIVNTGDLVSDGSDASKWRRFHEENRPIFSKDIPYYPGLGNHEYIGDNERALANYFGAFPRLKNRKWYEIRFREVLIAILDSNFGNLEPNEIEAQDRWLSDLLAAAERDAGVRHVIVCCHHAPYTNSLVHSDSKKVQEHFVSRLVPKARVFLTGHVHSYERFVKNGVQFVVSGGGGAPLTALDTGEPEHEDRYKGPSYRPFHYCRFTLEDGRLICDVVMLQDDRTWKRVDGFEYP
jgi:hypothetical protein